ncbi:hypothetical protein BLI708_02635 [Bifidobacterium imperatoris]|uniref:Uncharacterized protein n=1 Tax=Bifidobacterium imperatoris TaxID=2020965 RepID=A0A2N5IQ21_9BIFI|nr:hypothetical protein [Bifidobacterium imperatoris]PLS24036.1 hypothetical protein Tam1G_1872 [Bifidobacterium imperatoris]QSY58220.1 hypothetical protein BLI708_02635 [Bifidobacterium imperatoris]
MMAARIGKRIIGVIDALLIIVVAAVFAMPVHAAEVVESAAPTGRALAMTGSNILSVVVVVVVLLVLAAVLFAFSKRKQPRQ